MKVLNLHGFMGKADNRTYSALRKLLPKENLVSPHIDYMKEHPSNLLKRLGKIVSEEKVDFVIGQSLGGFFAVRLAATYGLKCILTNPCLYPAETKVIVDSELDRDILYEYTQIPEPHSYKRTEVYISNNDTIIPDNYNRCRALFDHVMLVEGTHSKIEDLVGWLDVSFEFMTMTDFDRKNKRRG